MRSRPRDTNDMRRFVKEKIHMTTIACPAISSGKVGDEAAEIILRHLLHNYAAVERASIREDQDYDGERTDEVSVMTFLPLFPFLFK